MGQQNTTRKEAVESLIFQFSISSQLLWVWYCLYHLRQRHKSISCGGLVLVLRNSKFGSKRGFFEGEHISNKQRESSSSISTFEFEFEFEFQF